jgi:hypothetical protein
MAIPAAAGLYLFSRADSAVAAFAAAALLAIGTAFWWPTMLGITSERFPRAGALGARHHRRHRQLRHCHRWSR